MLEWLLPKSQMITIAGENVEKRKPLYTVGRNVNWQKNNGKQYRFSSKKLKKKIELPYDPAIPILGIYSKEIKITSQRNICTLMFTAALFTAVRIWQQPKSPIYMYISIYITYM